VAAVDGAAGVAGSEPDGDAAVRAGGGTDCPEGTGAGSAGGAAAVGASDTERVAGTTLSVVDGIAATAAGGGAGCGGAICSGATGAGGGGGNDGVTFVDAAGVGLFGEADRSGAAACRPGMKEGSSRVSTSR